MIIGIIIKFIKYEKRLRKEGNMLGLPINNNQALPCIFLSQTDLTRTGIISNSYNEMFEA
jgi:hypothetical protein